VKVELMVYWFYFFIWGETGEWLVKPGVKAVQLRVGGATYRAAIGTIL